MSDGTRTRARTFSALRDAATGRPVTCASRRRAPAPDTCAAGAKRARQCWPEKTEMQTGRGRNAPQSDTRRAASPSGNLGARLFAKAQVRKAPGARAGGCAVGAQKFELARQSRGRYGAPQAAARARTPAASTVRPVAGCAAAQKQQALDGG